MVSVESTQQRSGASLGENIYRIKAVHTKLLSSLFSSLSYIYICMFHKFVKARACSNCTRIKMCVFTMCECAKVDSPERLKTNKKLILQRIERPDVVAILHDILLQK